MLYVQGNQLYRKLENRTGYAPVTSIREDPKLGSRTAYTFLPAGRGVCLAVPRGLPPLTGLSAGDDLNLCIDKDTDPLLLVITATDRDNFGAETWLAWDDAWKTGDRIPAWKILRVQDGWVEVGPRQLQVRLFNSASEARRDPSMGS